METVRARYCDVLGRAVTLLDRSSDLFGRDNLKIQQFAESFESFDRVYVRSAVLPSNK